MRASILAVALVLPTLLAPAAAAGAPDWTRSSEVSERARLREDRGLEAIAFSAEGPEVRLARGEPTTDPLTVLERTPTRLRVVHVSGAATLAAWLPVSAFAPVATREVHLAPSEAHVVKRRSARSVGAWLAAGEPMRQVTPAPGNGLAEVTWWRGDTRATGLAPQDAFDVVWRAPKRAPKPKAGGRVKLLPGASLAAEPGGEPFAWLGAGSDAEPPLGDVLTRRAEAALVRVRWPGAELVGWVRAEHVGEPNVFGTLFGGGGFGALYGAMGEAMTVAAGTTLHGAPGGPAVGVATAERNLRVESVGSGRWRLVKVKAFGSWVPVWVEASAEP